MLRKAGILLVAGVLGGGSAFGVAACGEDRGDVQIEGGTTGTGTGGTSTTAGTETGRTETGRTAETGRTTTTSP